MTLFDKVYWQIPPDIRLKYDHVVLDGEDADEEEPQGGKEMKELEELANVSINKDPIMISCGMAEGFVPDRGVQKTAASDSKKRRKKPPRAGTFSRTRSGGAVEPTNITNISAPDDVDPLHSLSTYHDYPVNQPFINDPYRRPANKPISSYPESNRQAVMSALKGLQDKIRNLELERSTAEDNLKLLANETTRYQDILQQGPDPAAYAPPHTTVSQNTQGNTAPTKSTTPTDSPHRHHKETNPNTVHQHKELEAHLQAAENRSNLLEKQLEYMRRMVHAAEEDRSEAVRKSRELEAQRQKDAQYDFVDASRNKGKLAELEREHIKLTASQSLAESKIRELEDRLHEERHHRRLMQDKAAQLASSAEANRILQAKSNNVPKKIKKKVTNKRSNPAPGSNNWSDHYRLNLADMPFVAGKSTGPSHSVPANVQKVLSMMKNHNNVLCPCSPRAPVEPPTHDVNSTEMTNGHDTGLSSANDHHHYDKQSSGKKGLLMFQSGRGRGGHGQRTSRADLASLLLQLQDEFAQLSYEHQELCAQINESTDARLRDDLERELDHTVAKMEMKGDQIAMLRKHQESAHKKKKKAKSARVRPASASATLSAAGEVEVRTTIKTKSGGSSRHTPVSYARPTASSAGKASLKLLKDLKKIQSTLRKDDLSWDC